MPDDGNLSPTARERLIVVETLLNEVRAEVRHLTESVQRLTEHFHNQRGAMRISERVGSVVVALAAAAIGALAAMVPTFFHK